MAKKTKKQSGASAGAGPAETGKAGAASKAGGKAGAASNGANGGPPPRLEAHYRDRVVPKLMSEFGYRNAFQAARIEKVVVNCGVGEAPKTPKLLDAAIEELVAITGQQPQLRRARKAISNFALRAGMPIGARVTLRRQRMYEFLDRLINVAIPRIRDFRGLSTRSFDGRGNYSMGIKEQVIFPEVDYDKVAQIHGFDITIVTSTDKDDEALALLREMGMPFRGAQPVTVTGEGVRTGEE